MRSAVHCANPAMAGTRRSPGFAALISGQGGQALVEFMIAAGTLLVPLFFMISYLAKYHDMQSATIQAARYAAWERTVYFGESDWAGATAQKSDPAIQAEIRSRFFSGPGAGFESGAANPLWQDHAGAPLLGTWNQASANAQTPGTGDFVLGQVNRVISAVGRVLGSAGFKLDMNTLYTANVTATPAPSVAVSAMFSGTAAGFGLPLLRERSVLVANGWSANGPDFVESQTESLSLTSVFSRPPLDSVLSVLQGIGGAAHEELRPQYLKLGGDIQVDHVPPDRLSGGAAPPARRVSVPAADRMEQTRRDQEQKAQADRARFEAAITSFHNEYNAIQRKLNDCAEQKQQEMWGNYYGAGTRWTRNGCSRSVSYCSLDGGLFCLRYSSRTETYDCNIAFEYVKPRPGSSWTPNFDADASCHAGLDARISQLQTNLDNEPVVREARTACASSTAPDCTSMNAKLEELEAMIRGHRASRSALDNPLSSCTCSTGDGTTCVSDRTRTNGAGARLYTCR